MTDFLDGLAYYAVRFLSSFLSRLSPEKAQRVGALAGRIGFWFSNRRRVAYSDLKAAFGDKHSEKERWNIVRQHYIHLGQMFVEILRLPSFDWQKNEKKFRVDGDQDPARFVDEGCIFLTGHFGNWELLQVKATELFGKSIFALARPQQKFPRLNAYLDELRHRSGFVVIHRGMGVRDLLRSLRRKEWIGLLGDQDAGKQGGLILPIFGRKTTVPTGAFELASRTGVSIVPVFIVRRESDAHTVFVNKELPFPGKDGEKMEESLRAYIQVLEKFVSKHPEQWLWETKRWKYTWTKRILILSDGKPGHVKQSEAVAAQMQSIETQYGRPGMEYPTETVHIEFKSRLHRKLFPWFAFFFIPYAQGKLRYLSFFFKPETQKKILSASAEFVISAGSSLVPLNLCLARDSRAKSIVLMKPAFPFNLFRYDLAVIPAHDKGFVPEGAFRTVLTPCIMDPAQIEKAAEKISVGLREPGCVKTALFLGGATRRYPMHLADVKRICDALEKIAEEYGDYVITTSRRTPQEICDYLKREVAGRAGCQMLVIATEDSRREVLPGMMGLAETLIVTEDSISMISEAVNTGKRVVVLSSGAEGLPVKHKRFREILERESAVTISGPADLEQVLTRLRREDSKSGLRQEREALRKRLQEIL